MKFFLILYLILINLLGFSVMGIDKRRAIRHRWRVPERVLFGTAFCFGSIGNPDWHATCFATRQGICHSGSGSRPFLHFSCSLPVFFFSGMSAASDSLLSQSSRSSHALRNLTMRRSRPLSASENLTNSHIASGSPGDEATKAVCSFFQTLSIPHSQRTNFVRRHRRGQRNPYEH